MAQILIFILCIVTAHAGNVFKVKSFQELRFEGVVPQKYEESCGASSLATLMNLYGENLTEESLLDDLNTTDMVNFEDLQKIANVRGYKAKGYKVTKEIIEKISIPIIARVIRHKSYPHFIVINNLQGDFFLSLDSTSGKRLMSKSEFYNIWFSGDGGYILIVVPDDLRSANDIKEYHHLLKK